MTEDHPRIRGKDAGDKISQLVVIGSPPHTRERLMTTQDASDTRRITPAYAGKTIHFQKPSH